MIMTNYVGLDVSQKTTTLCIVDGDGHRQWRGECGTSPEQIVQAVLQHADAGARPIVVTVSCLAPPDRGSP
jgi:transposase